MVVRPSPDLGHAVLAQRDHPLLAGDRADLGRRGAGHGEPLDLLGHEHHLVQRQPALVAGLRARGQPTGRHRVGTGSSSGRPKRTAVSSSRSRLVLLGALAAQLAGQPLGEDGVQRRADQERLDVHLGEPDDGARRVVGVQRRQHQVTGERGLDGDLRGLVVADLAEEDDVGVRAQDRAQGRGEGEAGLGVHLHLVDPGEPVLDRVLDGDDVDLGLGDDVQRRVQRRRLARAGGPRHQDHPVGLDVAGLEAGVVASRRTRGPAGPCACSSCRGCA